MTRPCPVKAAADALRRLAADPSSVAECVAALKQVPLVHPLRGQPDHVVRAIATIEMLEFRRATPPDAAFLTALADKLEAGIDEMRRTGWGWVLGADEAPWFHAAPPNGELILPDVGL